MAINLALIKPAILKAKDIATIADVEAVKEYADTTVIDGSRITTGTIDADKINTVGLVVQNVSPGGINPTFEIKANGTAGPNANANIYGARISSGYIFSQGVMYIDLVNGEYIYSMSLYIEKDNNGNNIFHLSKGVVSSVASAAAPIPGTTIFHSSYYPITVEVFDTSTYTTIAGSGLRSFELPSSLKNYIALYNYKLPVLVLINNMQVVCAQQHNYFYSDYVVADLSYSGALSEVPLSSSTRLEVGGDYVNSTSVRFIVINFNMYTGLSILNNYTSGIIINSNSVIINGVNITSLKYLSGTIMNDSDYVFSLANGTQIQIVNFYQRSGMVINSSSGNIIITSGGKKVLTSEYSFYGSLYPFIDKLEKVFSQNDSGFATNNAPQYKQLYNVAQFSGRFAMFYYIRPAISNYGITVPERLTNIVYLVVAPNSSALLEKVFVGTNYGYINIYLYIDNSYNAFIKIQGELSKSNSGTVYETGGYTAVFRAA